MTSWPFGDRPQRTLYRDRARDGCTDMESLEVVSSDIGVYLTRIRYDSARPATLLRLF
jgi:hypothetical protein